MDPDKTELKSPVIMKDIEVAEDTVTHQEEPIIDTVKNDNPLPSEATQTTSKKKTNKKK